MSMLGQWGAFDVAPEPTEAQQDYAASLLERLSNVGHPDVDDFEEEVEGCSDIGEMSDLIDTMKAELEEYE